MSKDEIKSQGGLNEKHTRPLYCLLGVIKFVTKQRVYLGTGIFTISLIASTTEIFALKPTHTLEKTPEKMRLEHPNLNPLPQFYKYPIEGLASTLPMGKHLTTLDKNKDPLTNYRAQNPVPVSESYKLEHSDPVIIASFSSDGEHILTASGEIARVWDRRGQLVAELTGHQDNVISASFSPDGDSLLTAAGETARVWDRQGQLLIELVGHQDPVLSASFSPDGESILTAAGDGIARVWDRPGNQIAELIGHKGSVISASFSPDGEHILTCSIKLKQTRT